MKTAIMIDDHCDFHFFFLYLTSRLLYFLVVFFCYFQQFYLRNHAKQLTLERWMRCECCGGTLRHHSFGNKNGFWGKSERVTSWLREECKEIAILDRIMT